MRPERGEFEGNNPHAEPPSFKSERSISSASRHGTTELPEGLEVTILAPELNRDQRRITIALTIVAEACGVLLGNLYERFPSGKALTARSMATLLLYSELDLTADEVARALKDQESAPLVHNRAYDFRSRLRRNQKLAHIYDEVLKRLASALAES